MIEDAKNSEKAMCRTMLTREGPAPALVGARVRARVRGLGTGG